MAWIALHQSVWTHRKTYALADALQIDDEGYAASHIMRLWSWALDNAPEGDLGHATPRTVARAAGWRGDAEVFTNALIDCGWLDRDEGGLRIHDWYEYAGKLIDRRRVDAERLKRWRQANKDETPVTPPDETRMKRISSSDEMRTPDVTVPNSTVENTGVFLSGTSVPQDVSSNGEKRGVRARAKTAALQLDADLATILATFSAAEVRGPSLVTDDEQRSARKLLGLGARPQEFVEYWQDVRAGKYGDAWDQRHLNFATLVRQDRFINWQAWKAGENGSVRPNGFSNGPQGGKKRI